MQIKLVIRDTEVTSQMRAHARQRAVNTFARFGHWFHEVVVRLTDINGPRGGVDKSVAIELATESGRPMRFETCAETYDQALARVLKRAKRKILASPQLGSRRPTRRSQLAL